MAVQVRAVYSVGVNWQSWAPPGHTGIDFMSNTVFRNTRISLLFAACGLLTAAAAQAQQPRSISDCRAIQGELARYACYESLEDPGAPAAPQAPAAAPAAPAAPAATTGAPARPVSNLPVVRRPSLSTEDLTRPAGAEAAPAQGGAVVRESGREEKRSLFSRLNPFGGDDAEEANDQPAVATAPSTGDSAVDTFGLASSQGEARVALNEDGDTELVDTVAALEELTRNTWQITLSSGQVWRQTVTKAIMLREGATVTIKPTRWGNDYRLSAEGVNGFIQVKRVK